MTAVGFRARLLQSGPVETDQDAALVHSRRTGGADAGEDLNFDVENFPHPFRSE
jgi:hypothetical protein